MTALQASAVVIGIRIRILQAELGGAAERVEEQKERLGEIRELIEVGREGGWGDEEDWDDLVGEE
jgi:hypothetical protein